MTSVIHCSGQVKCLWLQWYIADWKSAGLQQFLAECNKFARLNSIMSSARNHYQNKHKPNSPMSLFMHTSWGEVFLPWDTFNVFMCSTDRSLWNKKLSRYIIVAHYAHWHKKLHIKQDNKIKWWTGCCNKVKCNLVQALRLCTGCMAHRGSRGLTLLFHDHGTRRGVRGSASRPGRSLPPGKDPVSIVQEAGWAPGLVWTGAENHAPKWIQSPDHPARSYTNYATRPTCCNIMTLY
jgi:hypothetical protein